MTALPTVRISSWSGAISLTYLHHGALARRASIQRLEPAVLSIGELAAGAGAYYTSMVADGAEEY